MPTTSLKSVVSCHAAMASLSVSHPEWMAKYEDADPMAVGPLQELLDNAPNEFSKGVIIGKLSILREMPRPSRFGPKRPNIKSLQEGGHRG